MIATNYGVGQVVYSILWFFLLFLEVWLAISIFIDIFRSHDLKGWQKALWTLIVLIVPLIGILAYFIVRGDRMRAHQLQARQDEAAFDDFMRHRHGSPGNVVDQLSRLAELRREGIINDDEFDKLKARIVGHDSASASP